MKNQEIFDVVYKYQYDDWIQKLLRKSQVLKFCSLFLDMFKHKSSINLFLPELCTVTESGITTCGNPLTSVILFVFRRSSQKQSPSVL